MSFVRKIILFMLFFPTAIGSIVFSRKEFQDHEVLTEKLFLVMGKHCLICFWNSKNSYEFLDLVFKRCFQKKNSISVVRKGIKPIHNCEVLVFLNVSSAKICGLLLKNNRLLSFTFNFQIIIMNLNLSNDFLQLEHCSSSFDPASVTIITLQPEIFVLDSPLVSPRSFKPSRNYTGSLGSSLNKLHGRVINVATFHYPPFIEIIRNGSLVEYNGMEMNVWKELSKYLNFTWKLVEIKKGLEWGVFLENGTVVGGFVQAIREDGADVSFCNIWQQYNYLDSIDYGPQMNKISLTFIVRRPHQLDGNWNILTSVAQKTVWLTTLVALFAVSVVHCWACALHKTVPPSQPNLSRICENLLVMFGILTMSSAYVRSNTMLARLVVLGWFFFAVLLTSTITSAIVTRLTVPQYSPRIDTIQQLVEGDFYWTNSYYSDVGVSLKEFVFDFNNYWHMEFGSRNKRVKPEDLDNLIRTDVKVVLPAQRMGSEYIVVNVAGLNETTDLSRFRVMKSSMKDTYTSFVFRKRSPYNELFTRTIQSFIDLGLWAYWQKNTDDTAVRKHLLVEHEIRSFDTPQQLKLHKMYPVFLFLFIGQIAVCVVFFIEYFF